MKLWLTKLLQSMLLLLITCTATANDWDKWQQSSYIIDAFAEIALKNEYDNKTERIRKWIKPIRYKIIYYKLPQVNIVKKLVNIHFTHLAEITGLDIEPVNENETENFRIIITQDKNFDQVIKKFKKDAPQDLYKQTNCIAIMKQNTQYQITESTVIIPIDHAMFKGLLPACVVEEITQSLGLPNDSDWVNPSIANDVSKFDLLTGLDYILLKLLYNLDLKAGMNLNSTNEINRKKLEEMQRDNTIKQASSLVSKSGLNAQF